MHVLTVLSSTCRITDHRQCVQAANVLLFTHDRLFSATLPCFPSTVRHPSDRHLGRPRWRYANLKATSICAAAYRAVHQDFIIMRRPRASRWHARPLDPKSYIAMGLTRGIGKGRRLRAMAAVASFLARSVAQPPSAGGLRRECTAGGGCAAIPCHSRQALASPAGGDFSGRGRRLK